MNDKLSFFIPLIPTPQMRARHFVKKTKSGKYFQGTYKDASQRREENQLMQLLEKHLPEIPINKPIMFQMIAYMPIPESWAGWKKTAAKMGLIHPVGRPDLDNLLKNIIDCMTKIGFWRDDSLIIGYVSVDKKYSLKPGWFVQIETFNEPHTKKEFENMEDIV